MSEGVRALGDIAALTTMKAGPEMTPREFLRAHPGKGFTCLQNGMQRMLEHAAEMGVPQGTFPTLEAKAAEQYRKGEPLCDSPIERSMLAGLLTARWGGFLTLPPAVHAGLDYSEMLPRGDVVIVPQMAFVRYRFDFGVVMEIGGVKRIACVECDGQKYHQDAERERQRAAYLKSWGVPLFKSTGAELHEDAVEASSLIVAAICGWAAS